MKRNNILFFDLIKFIEEFQKSDFSNFELSFTISIKGSKSNHYTISFNNTNANEKFLVLQALQQVQTDFQRIDLVMKETKKDICSENGLKMVCYYFANIVKGKLVSVDPNELEDNHTASGRVPLEPNVKYLDFQILLSKID